jgi:exodeoxyribonuclease X
VTIDEAALVLIDSETTGVEDDAEIVEVAAYAIQGETRFETFVRPSRPIPPTASAIHHIVDADVADAPSRDAALADLAAFLPSGSVLVAHNADYDRKRLSPEFADRPWLCTMRLARHLVPDAPGFGNAALWYYLGGPKISFEMHRASADLVVTRFVLEQLLARYRAFAIERSAGDAERLAKSEQIETLLAFVEKPYLLKTMPFGKHRGQPLEAIDPGYFRWALGGGMQDLDNDLRWNFQRQLKLRGLAA